MKFLYTLPLAFISVANAENVNENVNWKNISSTPEVSQQVIVQDFVPADTKEDSFVQNQLTDFDFLEQSIDERVFYKFDAKLRILNKYTDKTTDYKVKPGQVLDLKKFKIQVKSCAIAQVNNVNNQFAFVEVIRKDEVAFKGWMSNIHKTMNFPELRELYVNLISCDKDLHAEEVDIETVKEISAPTELKINFN